MTRQPERSGRIHALDGLRGYAALAVIFFHSIAIFVQRQPGGMNAILGNSVWDVPHDQIFTRIVLTILNGQTAVMIFFAISGAVLVRSMRAETTKDWLLLPATFTLKRILRIYPALIVSLAAFYGLFKGLSAFFPTHFSAYTPHQFVENATLHAISVNGATWTLQVEMLAIPLMLLAFALKKSVGIIGLIAMLSYSLVVREDPALSLGSVSAYLWMPYFMAGILASEFSKTDALRDATSHGKWFLVLLTVIFVTAITNPAFVSSSIIQCMAVFLLTSHIMGDTDSGLKRFLSRPASQYLGRISYGLYLWNVPFLEVVRGFCVNHKSWPHAIFLGILVGSLITLITIPFAHVSERYLDRLHRTRSVILGLQAQRTSTQRPSV